MKLKQLFKSNTVKKFDSRVVRERRGPHNTAFHWTQVPGDSRLSAWRIRKLGGGVTFAEPDTFWPSSPSVDYETALEKL